MRLTGPARVFRRISAAALAVVLATSPVDAAAPRRIVSINLCIDQVLLAVADRSRIASVTWLAADPSLSADAETARGLPLNHGLAEEVLTFAPDLVLAADTALRPTAAVLRGLGLRVETVPMARTVAEVPGLIRRVAALAGAPARGARTAAAFERRIAAAAPPPGPRPTAAIYYPNGLSSGAGTLPGSVIEAAGFENLAARLGGHGDAPLPIERLLLAHPDLLVTGHADAAPPAETLSLLAHPALRQALAGVPRVAVPERAWICGTPATAAAVARLAALRREIAGR